tara:strand:+ start:402 stop:632 length:231 start_codon:yes stop_codon:yes gene_type:complete
METNYADMTVEELLNARIELQKKRAVAMRASNSMMVAQQFELIMNEINFQIQLKNQKAQMDADDKSDDLDDIINIG